MLGAIDKETSKEMLAGLMERDADLAQEIRSQMFVFDDIAKLSDRDIQTILKVIKADIWKTALRATSEELKEKIFTNMSKRAAKMLKEDIEEIGRAHV